MHAPHPQQDLLQPWHIESKLAMITENVACFIEYEMVKADDLGIYGWHLALADVFDVHLSASVRRVTYFNKRMAGWSR